MSLDTAFQRTEYAQVVMDVRKFNPSVNLREAWVYKVGRDHWEFHYQEFFWHGSAGGAFDARAIGWSRYLASKKVEGYAIA